MKKLPVHLPSFFSTTSVLAIVLFVCISLGAVNFYKRSTEIMFNDLRNNLITSATLAADQFRGEDIEAVTADTVDLQMTLSDKLEHIKQTVPDAYYVYILESTNDPQYVAFVAENDMFYSFERLDVNNNGRLDDNEVAVEYGEEYEVAQAPNIKRAFLTPIADNQFTSDEWGTWMSAYAPIFTENGKSVAILGIDIKASTFLANSQRILSPGIVGITFLGAFLLAFTFIVVSYKRRVFYQNQLQQTRKELIRQSVVHLGDPISTLSYWTELLGDDEIDQKQVQEVLTEACEKLNAVVRELNEISE